MRLNLKPLTRYADFGVVEKLFGQVKMISFSEAQKSDKVVCRSELEGSVLAKSEL
jgi:hypothetical protein